MIPNAITTDKDNSTDLVFSYNKFKNPRSTNAICQSFTVEITNKDGNALESGTGGSITVNTPNILLSFSITPTPTNMINGGTATYSISSTANSNTPLITGDKYILVFPSEISLVTAVMCAECTRDSDTQLTYTLTADANTISFDITDLTVQSSTQPVTTPVDVKVVTSTGISQVISTHNAYKIPTTSLPGTLASPSLIQSSKVAATPATYQFTFTLTNKIPINGLIAIENTPALTFSFEGSKECITPTSELGACTVSAGTVLIPVIAEIPKDRVLTILVDNYTNPKTPSSTSFTVKTYTDNARTYIIDKADTGMVPSLN